MGDRRAVQPAATAIASRCAMNAFMHLIKRAPQLTDRGDEVPWSSGTHVCSSGSGRGFTSKVENNEVSYSLVLKHFPGPIGKIGSGYKVEIDSDQRARTLEVRSFAKKLVFRVGSVLN